MGNINILSIKQLDTMWAYAQNVNNKAVYYATIEMLQTGGLCARYKLLQAERDSRIHA
jgi:hypothetical protein